MNVINVITGIQFIGKGKIMLQYLIPGNLQDILRTLPRGEKEKIPILRDIIVSKLSSSELLYKVIEI